MAAAAPWRSWGLCRLLIRLRLAAARETTTTVATPPMRCWDRHSAVLSSTAHRSPRRWRHGRRRWPPLATSRTRRSKNTTRLVPLAPLLHAAVASALPGQRHARRSHAGHARRSTLPRRNSMRRWRRLRMTPQAARSHRLMIQQLPHPVPPPRRARGRCGAQSVPPLHLSPPVAVIPRRRRSLDSGRQLVVVRWWRWRI